jgi:hypothetical protein
MGRNQGTEDGGKKVRKRKMRGGAGGHLVKGCKVNGENWRKTGEVVPLCQFSASSPANGKGCLLSQDHIQSA